MVNIIRGATNKPFASNKLKEYFQKANNLNGQLFIGYPIIGTVEGAYPIDALWVSPESGLVAFNLIENKLDEDYKETQDDYANKIEAKLRGYSQLVNRRELCVEISVITFAPFVLELDESNKDYPLVNMDTIDNVIRTIKWENSDYYEHLVSVLQAISTIRKGKKKRIINNEQSRGAKIRALEDSIANLDNMQSIAVIESVEGVQRIRGLAGSGKTIVLALKAAYLHAQHPEWKIAITFNTRSLKGQLRQLINTFYIEQANDEPDWDNLEIMHAWGAPGGGDRNGLYYSFCLRNNTLYYDYLSAKEKYGDNDTFGDVCKNALEEAKGEVEEVYDAILVDEAQDFSPSFLKLCYEMLKHPKRLVYAYDELQNLRMQSLPSPEEIFGNHENGNPRVKFYPPEDGKPRQDIILEKCYRNSRPALVTAHALGFGIYRKQDEKLKTGLVQMFEQNSLWQDIGYKIAEGKLEDGKHVVLKRTSDSSPDFLERHSDIDDLIQFKSFDTQKEHDEWIASQIKENLQQDELRADDIIVVNPNPLSTRKKVGPIREILYKERINSHTAGVDTTPDVFFTGDNNSVAFTGIYRAKGNEAAMVYVINAQSCYDSLYDLATIRNRLFTAITRSKAWVRVVGIGENMEKLIEEYDEIKKHNFTLDFIYPNKYQRDRMNIVNRDMSEAERRKVEKSNTNIESIINELENGEIFAEDLDADRIQHLLSLLKRKE